MAAQSDSVPDPRFGVVESFWAPDEAAELNVGWERILFYWSELQPTGPEDWNTLHVREEWLEHADLAGRTVVGLLKNTAPWASEDGIESGLPKGLFLPVDDPDNLWANFVRRTVNYYSVRNVHHWIIWNEPEIRAGVYGFEFAGSAADYYRLLKVAYLAIKETDPEAVIHLAGITWWHDQSFLGRFLQVAMADPEGPENDYFFDIISLHIYFRSETVQSLLNAVKAIQNDFGISKPVWINETNASPNKDPLWPVERPVFQIDLEQQAWYIIQAFALGFANGADRIAVYKLVDILLPPGGESFGLLRPDFSRRPAFEAYKTTIQYLSNFTDVDKIEEDDYFVVGFNRPEGVTRVIWTRTATALSLRVPALADEALLVNAIGEAEVITAEDNTYIITLAGARCDEECIIGGRPVLLVELGVRQHEVQPPTPVKVDGLLVTVTPTLTPTPIPTSTDTLTTTPSPAPTATSTPSPITNPTATALITNTPLPTKTPKPSSPPGSSQAETSQLSSSNPDQSSDIATTTQGTSYGGLFLAAGALLTLGLAFWLRRNR